MGKVPGPQIDGGWRAT